MLIMPALDVKVSLCWLPKKESLPNASHCVSMVLNVPQFWYFIDMSLAGRVLVRRPFATSQLLYGTCESCRAKVPTRPLTSTRAKQERQRDRPFGTRLRVALRDTKTPWYWIPVGSGITFLGAVQFYRFQKREKRRQEAEDALDEETREEGGERPGKPKKRKRIRPSGPWYVK